jgi:hypothetical protein
MRDERFIAVHRGGSLELDAHRLLALWAADCAGRVLPLLTASGADDRPQRAVDAARSWARGELSVGAAREAAFGAHAAARSAAGAAASAAARSAGHAAATAHMADHALQAAGYALKAVYAAGMSAEAERFWQDDRLPESIRSLVLSARQYPVPQN